MLGKLYPLGYLASDAQAKLDELVRDPYTFILDIRYNAVSRKPGWSGKVLRENYERAYCALSGLGNKNYNKPGMPIEIAMPETITDVVEQLRRGFSFILLCACKDYETCHRKTVVELIQAQLPEIEVVQ